jgi:hypothetical protein
MNPVERVLDDEVGRLLDRLAASMPDGCLQAMGTKTPAWRRRLDEVDGQMATIRATLLEGYGRWRRALEDAENLWALAAWRTDAEASASEEPASSASSLAA